MKISAPDDLVGAIALEYVLAKFRANLEEGSAFRGAFHVLSGFTSEQLVGFIKAAENAGSAATRLRIQFPQSELSAFGVDGRHLTTASSVDVRNRDRDGFITLAAEEADSEGSFGHSDQTDASDLKDKSIAHVWVEFVAQRLGLTLLPEEKKRVEAMTKGLFDCRGCPTPKAGEFLWAVLEKNKAGEPLSRAAGKSLPVIGLPLFEDCFSSLNEAKMGQASQWATKFRAHYNLEEYLNKRAPTQEPLDREKLRERLLLLRQPDYQPVIPDAVLQSFEEYIEAPARSPATERLLFDYDWQYTTHCFDRNRKTTAKDFAQQTRDALEAEGVKLTRDDETILQALAKISRKPGGATDEFREFFERRADALETDTALYVEWEDFIHGKKIECTDLYEGLIECVHRAIRGLSSEAAYIILEGKQQKKPNSFVEINQRACEFFEWAYGQLEAKTRGKIQFKDTLICKYSEEVYPRIREKIKNTRAATLNFSVFIVQRQGGSEKRICSLSLSWKFELGSVLSQLRADLDAIKRYHLRRRTTLAGLVAEYEVVGRKGTPVPLSLESVEGFADIARGGGRGGFVPAQDRIESLAQAWRDAVAAAVEDSTLAPASAEKLGLAFSQFETSYNSLLLAYEGSALELGSTADMVSAYGALLEEINVLPMETRRQLLRVIMRVGVAQVSRSGSRPSMVIVCPWHPLRLEAIANRSQQIIGALERLLAKNRPAFSDGSSGNLFFKELSQLLAYPHYPEVVLAWENKQPLSRIVAQTYAGYTIHQPPETSSNVAKSAYDDSSSAAAKTIEREVLEFLRLQPHERDNLTILLYNCDSPALPIAVVSCINTLNTLRDDKITCHVLLTHLDKEHLRQIYRDLVARGVDGESDQTEASGEFLARVRVNITATNRLKPGKRSQPVDIAYCRDLVSREAKFEWLWQKRETVLAESFQPHQWSRRMPVSGKDPRVRLQLVCPAQTEAGWKHLRSIAALCANGADEAWAHQQCPIPVRCLDFDDEKVAQIFRETHELATWVVNQDELLDRKLLEARDIKVIRYIQSATHGRNLVISSKARETLLVNTLKEKLSAILPSQTKTETIEALLRLFIDDANKISGGLVLKAARRANNTSELLGMVLTKYLVQAELGMNRAIAWCFLDDYSEWLGKKEGANIADLLVLCPRMAGSTMHLDIVVTEAKFIMHDALQGAVSTSSKQLVDTLSQLTDALDPTVNTLDQDVWLARLSDLLVSQTVALENAPIDRQAWRRAIRDRKCTVSIWGYSHVFVAEPQDLSAQVSNTKGIVAGRGHSPMRAVQEIFGPDYVRELIQEYQISDYAATQALRLRNGHPGFGTTPVYNLASQRSDGPSTPDEPPEDSGKPIKPIEPDPKPSPAHTTSVQNETSAKEDAAPADVMEFLTQRAAKMRIAEDAGKAWLDDVTSRLRQALISRALPAKMALGTEPTLTPNAAIVRFQGSKDLTVQAVEANADEIFTSDGVKIIGTVPESGRISISIERPERQVLRAEPVLLAFLKKLAAGGVGEKLCVGLREENGEPLLLDPFNLPHTLIAGTTGSGKSVLVQNIILGIAAARSPDEAHIHLIDPKFGVDYRPLDELPHVQRGSGGIITDVKQAIASLQRLVEEMERRYQLLAASRVPNIDGYRKSTGKQLPTLWVVHDEFADWMQTDEYREQVPDLVGRLGVKARAAGIFLIFAAQRPDKDVMPPQFRAQLGNRLILKVDNAGTADVATGIKNSGAERLLGRGHMLAKTGDVPDFVHVQVPYLDMEETIPSMVQLIQKQYSNAGAKSV